MGSQWIHPPYLFLVGGADVEAGHHDGCPWHQVEFGVGGAIVCRPECKQTTSKHLDKNCKCFCGSFCPVMVS